LRMTRNFIPEDDDVRRAAFDDCDRDRRDVLRPRLGSISETVESMTAGLAGIVMNVFPPTLLAVRVHAHRFGSILLALIVLALLGWIAYALVGRYRARGGSVDATPGPPPSPMGSGGRSEPRERPTIEETNDGALASAAESPNEATAGDRGQRLERDRLAGASPIASHRAPAGEWAVETHGLMKRFGPNVAVDNVELLVPRGVAFGYLGPNGAGKTTLIRTLLGLTRANEGSMALLGIPVPGERSRALARVGAIVDEPRFYGHLTGRENLLLLAAARGTGAEERIAPSLQRVGLTERADHKVAAYSMGMRQRLGVASCLLGDPELLILDEPMNGLDPAGMHQMREMIQSLVREGRTVMLSSHLLDEVERTCDAVAIVDHGRVIRQGPIDELVRGAGASVAQIDCSDPATAAHLIEAAGVAAGTSIDEQGLKVTLPAGAPRELLAQINRLLVNGGVSVYRLVEVRTRLEDWFLSVTSRLGEPE